MYRPVFALVEATVHWAVAFEIGSNPHPSKKETHLLVCLFLVGDGGFEPPKA